MKNYLARYEAKDLAEKINNYWKERGVEANARVEAEELNVGHVYVIRSDLKQGGVAQEGIRK